MLRQLSRPSVLALKHLSSSACAAGQPPGHRASPRRLLWRLTGCLLALVLLLALGLSWRGAPSTSRAVQHRWRSKFTLFSFFLPHRALMLGRSGGVAKHLGGGLEPLQCCSGPIGLTIM